MYACLDSVMDPELDRSIVEMDFLSEVTIDGSKLAVKFELPTYWCATNFALLMALGIKRSVRRLAWIEDMSIMLENHLCSDEINAAVNADTSGSISFTGMDASKLERLDEDFKRKAFFGRQAAVLKELATSQPVDEILQMTMKDLELLTHAGKAAALAVRYHEARSRQQAAPGCSHLAFIDFEGKQIAAGAYQEHLRQVRRIRRAAEANAQICGLLLSERRSKDRAGHQTGALAHWSPIITSWEQ